MLTLPNILTLSRIVAVPLLASGRVRGVITGDGIAHEDSLDQLLCDLSDLVALSLINAEATAQLTARATTDPLTGLANHRTFKERLDNEVRRAVRHERALGLLVMDVDDFKQVNDSYGHQVGDQINQEYKSALRIERLSRAQVAAALVDLKRRIQGSFYVIEENAQKIVFGNRDCPFGDKVRDRPAMCMMTSNVFGVIAAENLGYAKVTLEKTIAQGHGECRVVVYLQPEADTGGFAAREYFES